LFDEKQKAIQLLNDFSLNVKNLNRAFITISKYYKHIGLNKERTSDLLLDWLKKQNCNLEFSIVISELEKAVNNVYKKDYIFIYDIKINIFRNEIDYINKLKSKGERKIALSLLYLSKLFGNNFYCYHFTLHKITKLSVRQIKRIIKKLNLCGFIDIVDRNRTKKCIMKNGVSVKVYSFPNTYKLNIIGEGEILLSCGDIEDINDILNLINC